MRRFITMLIVSLMLTLGAATASAQASVATVTGITLPLNVRTAPSTSAGIVAAVNSGMSYAVQGRLADNSWWEINLYPLGVNGWVSGQFVSVSNPHLVPVKAAPAATPATMASATITAWFLNVRSIPNPYTGAVQTVVPRSQTFRIIGKNNTSPTWYQIQLPTGASGWINGNYANIENAGLAPITYTESSPAPAPTIAYGTVANAYFLNLRSTPNPYVNNNILTMLARNQTYPVIGKNAAGTWWQLNVNGIIGWVNGNYLNITNSHVVPVTY